jgi:predicted DNA-binding mobile mystery protein A
MDSSTLRRTQLDEKLTPLRDRALPIRPDQGWIRTIREGIGMSLRQLGQRVGMTKASVAQMEQREAEGAITVNSIRKLANALEADVYYFVVPRRCLEEMVIGRAETLAKRLVREVADSMALEDQATSKERLAQLVEHHTERLLADESGLWDDV